MDTETTIPSGPNTVTTTTASQFFKNGAKLVGDIGILPGTSLLVDGNLKSGALHVVGGLVAKALLGPIGWLGVAAHAYTKSVTGKGLFDKYRVDVEKVD